MADIVKATALGIAPVGVRVLALASTKKDIGIAPCTEGALGDLKQDVTRRPANNS